MANSSEDIFSDMLAGGLLRHDDPRMQVVWEVVHRTLALTPSLNASTSVAEVRDRLSDIIGSPIPGSTVIFAPLYTNFGRHISIGENVFINHDCTMLDMGGITIGDHTQIGPKVSLITENHPVDPNNRKSLDLQPVHIGRNVWIGAAATILPGVSIGDNAIVAAGAVVTKPVPANTIVAGVPARVVRSI